MSRPGTGARSRPTVNFRSWMPLGLMALLIVVVGGYTQSQNDAFLTEFNINGLLIATLPLALLAMAQTNALMVRAIDVSLGALTTMGVVIASFTIGEGSSFAGVLLGILAVFGACLAIGAFNVVLIRVLGLAPIIATLANYSILIGLALLLRPIPEGAISREFADVMLYSVGFMPVAFVGVVVLAGLADLWLYRSSGGLLLRAVGLDEVSASRLGARVGFLFVRALFISAFAGALASFFLSSQVMIGDPAVGLGFTLTSIAAAVLGGASLFGGRGSFIGAVIGAVLLTEITTVVPFLGLDTSWAQILVGGLTLLALFLYQAPDLVSRARIAIGDLIGRVRSGTDATSAADQPVP